MYLIEKNISSTYILKVMYLHCVSFRCGIMLQASSNINIISLIQAFGIGKYLLNCRYLAMTSMCRIHRYLCMYVCMYDSTYQWYLINIVGISFTYMVRLSCRFYVSLIGIRKISYPTVYTYIHIIFWD